MSPSEREQDLQETLRDLQEDAALLRMALLAAQPPADGLTLSCLRRLSGYLEQHIRDLCTLCRVRT